VKESIPKNEFRIPNRLEPSSPKDFPLTIPGICLMEATATINSRVYDGVEPRRRLRDEATQLRRNLQPAAARQLLEHLEEAQVACDGSIEGIMADVQGVIRKVGSTGRMIPLGKSHLKGAFSSIVVEAEQKDRILSDNLIIHCIPNDTRRHPAASKASVSGNRPEFTRAAVLTPLEAAGIDKYFTDAKNAPGWYRSRPAP
jgi:hypothetical protein